MKKYLLLFLMCVYASIGAWAVDATVTITTGSGSTANATINSNANCENIQNTDGWQTVAANTKFIGDYSGMVWANLWWNVYNPGSGNSRFDFSEASNVSVSNIETLMGLYSNNTQSYCFVGVTKLVLPNSIAIPSDISSLNSSGKLKFVFSTIDSSTGEYQIYVTSNLTSTSDLSEDITSSVITALQGTGTIKIVGDPTAVALVQNWLTGTNNVPAANITALPTKDPIEYDNTNACVITINRDYSSDSVDDLLKAAQNHLSDENPATADICTIKINGSLSATDLSDLGGTYAAGVTRIDMSEATLASGVNINSLAIPTTLTSLVLPEAQTVDATLAATLKGATDLKYAYSPTSDAGATVPDYFYVFKSGGLESGIINESTTNSTTGQKSFDGIYIKVESSVALNSDDVDFTYANLGGSMAYQYIDFSKANFPKSLVGDYKNGVNNGYRIILPDNWTGNEMAAFKANINSGSLAAVYSYDDTKLNIMEINDGSYSPTALSDGRIVRDGTTAIEVVAGTYNGTTYHSFGSNLLAAINGAKSSITSVKISTGSVDEMTLTDGTRALTFTNSNITSLDLENVSSSTAALNVDALTSLNTLNLANSNLKSIQADIAALKNVDLSGARVSGETSLSGASLMTSDAVTLITDSYTNLNVLDLTGSGLTSFVPKGTITGNVFLNASASLESLDLRQVTLGTDNKIHIDESTGEVTNDGDAIALTTIKVPTGFKSSSRFHPYPETIKDKITYDAYVPDPVTITATDMKLHEKNAGNDNDYYIYWYQHNPSAPVGKNVTLGTGGSQTLASILSDSEKAAQLDFAKSTYVIAKVEGPIASTDISSLDDINCQVLDLSQATFDEAAWNALKTAFKTSGGGINSNVRYVIMPDTCTRESIINESALSNLTNVLGVVALNKTENGTDLTSWSRVSGALQGAVVAAANRSCNSWTKSPDGNTNRNIYTSDISDFKVCKISGLINSHDLSKANQKLDSKGHLSWDSDPVETSTGIDPRKINGDYEVFGPFGASFNLSVIDLKNAHFEEWETQGSGTGYFTRYYASDMTLSVLGIISNATYKVVVPQHPQVNEIPADFMNCATLIRAICIPSNIRVIRTRAFKTIDYVWTTPSPSGMEGIDPEGTNTRLDNGAKLSIDGGSTYIPVNALKYENGAYIENPDFLDSYYTASYTTINGGGTYTFGSNMRMIETNAFANTEPNVKDVYVLNTKAPECHVDAFNTVMYSGNGGYQGLVSGEVIITREAYFNGRWITMLHYPRQTTTPELQRYTDPTREYSIATGLRDGKGATIYFPNQSEYIRAYQQGTYGYIWNAWNPERDNTNGVNNGDLTNTTQGWSAEGQSTANYLFNQYTSGTDHKYTSFYKVNGWDGLTTSATTENDALVPYYSVYWDDRNYSTSGDATDQLYPQSEKYTGTNEDTEFDLDNSGEATPKDYRGWHQFVLNAYAANTVLQEEPYRSYITDNDWWTVCMPFSVTRAEAIQLFGTPGETPALPKVCRLQYVIRNLNNAGITLYFSKNLLENSEGLGEYNAESIKQHGTNLTNDVVTLSEGTAPRDNDIVMAAGVPYLIKPNMTNIGTEAQPYYNRQFRVYTEADYEKLSDAEKNATSPKAIANDALFTRIQAAQTLAGSDQMTLVQNGVCKVPTFVTKDKDSRVSDETNDGGSYTINGKEYAKSSAFYYAFVGSFYKSFMPQYSYYLGWNSTQQKAQFFYKSSAKENAMTWINETGIILPSTAVFNSTVTAASGKNPAQWVLTGTNDSFVINNNSTAKSYNMLFDAPEVISAGGEVTSIDNFADDANDSYNDNAKVYTVNGQYVGTSLKGLAKGVYIVNGKKFIVK